jgi:hypothetical protein
MNENPFESPQESTGYVPSPQGGGNIPNYLVHSILVTLCCCLPCGIVAIVYAAQVNPKQTAGDHAGAQSASDSAKMWCLIGFVPGVIIYVLYFLMIFLSAAAGVQ